MSYIGHRCGCGHTDLQHTTSDGGRRTCRANGGKSCGNGCRKVEKAVIIPTFDINGRRIGAVSAPGTPLPALGTTCACKACKELYAQLAAA